MSDARTPISPTFSIATIVGSCLELFDVGVYAFFAVMIGKAFFQPPAPALPPPD